MIDLKPFIYIMPFFAAILWGLNYTIYGQILKSITVPTLMIYIAAVNIVSALIFSNVAGEKIDITSPFDDARLGALFVTVLICGVIAWLITLNVVKFVSPTYAAIGEIAYPVFIPIFAYFIFGQKQWDWPTLLGGALIFSGLFVMIYFKSHKALP